MRAELIEDGGRSASSAEFFRSPEFLSAEGATHTLAIDGPTEPLELPVIVRPIPGSDRVDAISPYGYPGAARGPQDPLDPTGVDWSATGLVSLFVRDRIGPPSMAGGTERSEVQVADPSLQSGMRKRLREQIRSSERSGWRVAVETGRETLAEGRAAFEAAYAETMARTGASQGYLFSSEYFAEVLSAERTWLLLAAGGDETPRAGAIAVGSDGFLHYFLGGTADAALEDSPMKNLFAAMVELATTLSVPLNLGGGVAPGDSLERFKRGFANRTEPFRTHEIVCDPAAYRELSEGVRAPGHFFPGYRSR